MVKIFVRRIYLLLEKRLLFAWFRGECDCFKGLAKASLHVSAAAMANCRIIEIVDHWKKLTKDSSNVEQEELKLTSTSEDKELAMTHAWQ